MPRSRSFLFTLALVASAMPIRAQDKPTEAMVLTIAGSWQIDTARSELAPAGLAAMLNQGQRPAAAPRLDTAVAAAAAPAGAVRREFKPLGENELEVKLIVNVGKKMEQKLVYTRVP